MQEHKVILTMEAIYDVTDMADYIEMNFSMEEADRFQNAMKEQISILETMGSIFGTTEIYYRRYVIHKKPFPPSIIFYIIKEPEKEIHVLRVLREERDWRRILKEKQEYTYM